jgi:large subunit ribosomal protein L29
VKASELAELTDEELATQLRDAKEELFNLRFQNVTGQLDNHNRLGEVRRDIARIFTVMRQREMAGGPVVQAPAARPGRRRLGRRNRKA